MTIRKIAMLCGAFVLVLGAMLGATGAQAGKVRLISPTGAGATAVGNIGVNSALFDLGATIDASITNGITGETVSSDPLFPTGTTSVTANTMAAVAVGNSNVTTTVDPLSLIYTVGILPLVDGGSANSDGISVLDYSINAPAAGPTLTQITSEVNDSHFTQTLPDFQVGTAALDSNTITANTTLNTETSYIVGEVPIGYSGDITGGAVLNFGGSPTFQSQGSIAVFNGQVNAASEGDSGSSAALSDDSVVQLIQNLSITDEIVTSPPSVSSNELSAIFYGNTANNTVDLLFGAYGAFNGTVSLANAQANFDDGSIDGAGTIVADNSDSMISSTIETTTANSETLTGTLTVDHNTISSLAVGNSAFSGGSPASGNTIMIADGLDFFGFDTPYANNTAFGSSTVLDNVRGDLALMNVQVNDNNVGPGSAITALGAQTLNASITATVDNVASGNVGPAYNAITSTSQGAQAYNGIFAGGANTATFDGSASLGSTQVNSNTDFAATVSDSEIDAEVAQLTAQAVTYSSVDVSHNSIGAYAGAGSVTNVLSIQATNVTLGDTTVTPYATLTAERDITNGNNISDNASGGAIINNVQNSYSDGNAATTAVNDANIIELLASADTLVDHDNLTENFNTIEALARTNNGSSLITLSGATIDGTAGVLTEQTADNSTSATVTDPSITLQTVTSGLLGTAVSASNLSLSSNVIRSLAYGNDGGGAIQVLNTVTFDLVSADATATAITIDLTDTPFDGTAVTAPAVKGALAVFTDQALSGDVNALTQSTAGVPIYLAVGSDDGGVAGSSITENSNAYVAAARGNVSDNGITATITTLAETAFGYEPAANITNVQTIEDGVTISANANSGDNSTILLDISQNIDSSGGGVSADNNLLTAIAGGNYGTNTMEITATTVTDPHPDRIMTGATLNLSVATPNLTTDAAFSISNAQFTGADTITASLDTLGRDPAIEILTGSSVGSSVNASTVSASGNTFTSTAVANTDTSTLSFDPVTLYAEASINSLQASYADVTATTLNGTLGVEINVGGGLINASTLNINNSLFDADATGNSATNTLYAQGTNVKDGSGAASESFFSFTGLNDYARGTFSLLNNQLLGAGDITASSYGSDIIYCNGGTCDPTGSTLSVSNNAQQAIALGSTANNSIDLSMTGSSGPWPTASLTSFQLNQSGTSVTATAEYGAQSSGQVTASSVYLDGNTNLALAEINDVTNSLSTSSDAVLNSNSGAGGSASFDPVALSLTTIADYAVGNVQSATGSVAATADTGIENNDRGGTQNTSASAISLSNNATTAEADANKASNSLSLTAGSTLAAGGALSNAQTSDATVNATASSNILYDSAASFDGSTVKANGNTTAAIANGNTSSNALNADAGSLYNGAVNGAQASNAGGVLNATAQYAVLNAQNNTGNVGASITAGGVQIGTTTPNAPLGGTTGTVNGSSADVSNNAFLAQATGNDVTNSVSFTGLVGGTPSAAIENSQQNSGNLVSANVTGVTMGINAAGVVSSSMNVNNNHITASATGNSAVNIITAH